jgi:tagatose-6-phosphate ketose/aldose isomerase
MDKNLTTIADGADRLLNGGFTKIQDMINDFAFDRLVYLGSNTNKGVAQESALKMLELTAGKVTTMFDTPLGFRHGPKSIINEKTLTVVYLSDNEYTREYEYDIIKEMSPQRHGNKILVVSTHHDDEIAGLVDYFYSFDNDQRLDNVFVGLEYIIVAQLIALYKSLSYKLTPDNPCPSGEVNRVVKGVIIYPYEK